MDSISSLNLHLSESTHSTSTNNVNTNQSSPINNQTVNILTAFSSHKRCFICQNTCRLHRIKSKSIASAFLIKRIVIKKASRVCEAHLDLNGQIIIEELEKIKTRMVQYDKTLVNLLDCISDLKKQQNETPFIFENFRDISELSDEQCHKITKWSKNQFINFSEYITSINETESRNKYQLIALYRFWLLKGSDQETLSYLFGNVSQQMISYYLDQIRSAINKDFVPFFLGASSRTREFYLKCNNQTAKTLFDLKDDDLVIVVDGSYARIEKSSNNDFQYSTYSQQKKDSLVKPFLICCCDGYIIDCYGPFKAFHNDATILRYILNSDTDLMSILTKDRTCLLLDRGIFLLYIFISNSIEL
jgi:hypothetical protein